MASAAENRRGVIAMLIATGCFVVNDTLMKLARETYPAGQAIALRTVFALMAALAMVVIFGEARKLGLALRPSVLLRSLIESSVALTFIWSLGYLPLANIVAITMASPIVIVVIAVLFRIERIGWRRTVAVLVGFCGVLVVVRPTAAGFSAAALVALLSTVLVSLRDLVTRKIGDDVPSTVISLAATAVVGLSGLALGALEVWTPIETRATLYLGVAALLVAAGSFFVISAFRHTDVSVISSYRYSVVVFAVLIGWMVWGQVPDLWSFAGIALIVGSGLYTMHRQRVRPDSNLKLARGTSS